MIQLIRTFKTVVWDTKLIWSDFHECTCKPRALWTFCIVNAVSSIFQCTWWVIFTFFFFLFFLFYALPFEKSKKEKMELPGRPCTGKIKEFGFLRYHTERLWHSFCGIKVSGGKSFLLKLYKTFFLMLWMLIGSKILVEINSYERNLCRETEKVTRGKVYFGIEQNVLFYGFSVIVNVFPVF